jgi:hypothetical protein
MGKRVYTVNGTMYIINDETGEIETIVIEKGKQIPPNDLKELVRLLAKNQKDD